MRSRHSSHVSATRLLAVIALLAVSFAVNAGFVVVSPPVEKKPVVTPLSIATAHAMEPAARPGLVEIGTRLESVELRRGFVRDLPLSVAVEQLAPKQWTREVRVTGDRKASWNAGAKGALWIDELKALAVREHLYGQVDWTQQRITITDREPAGAGKQKDAAPTLLASAAKPVVATPVQPAWEAKVGSTVRATVEEWGKRAGWMVVWETSDLDYRVVAPLKFDGSIVDATGKITRLYESAQRPLAVDIHVAQKVIVFSEKGAATP